MANLWTFAKTILTKGKFRIKRFDYQQNRIQELQEVIPESKQTLLKEDRWRKKLRFGLLRLPLLGSLLAILSFIKDRKRNPYYILEGQKSPIAYYRISKSACTSIQQALLQKDFPHLDFNNMTSYQINALAVPFIKSSPGSNLKLFTVVRDPIKRIISCYNDKVLPNLDNDSFYYYQDYMAGIIHPALSFEDFIALISTIPDAWKDMHFRPQNLFIPDDKNIKIFKLEEDQTQLTEFLNQYNLQLPSRNVSKRKTVAIHQLTNRVIAQIEKIYQQDYEKFGFRKRSNKEEYA